MRIGRTSEAAGPECDEGGFTEVEEDTIAVAEEDIARNGDEGGRNGAI